MESDSKRTHSTTHILPSLAAPHTNFTMTEMKCPNSIIVKRWAAVAPASINVIHFTAACDQTSPSHELSFILILLAGHTTPTVICAFNSCNKQVRINRRAVFTKTLKLKGFCDCQTLMFLVAHPNQMDSNGVCCRTICCTLQKYDFVFYYYLFALLSSTNI